MEIALPPHLLPLHPHHQGNPPNLPEQSKTRRDLLVLMITQIRPTITELILALVIIRLTFTTGVAGRATVLTEEAELLFGVTVGEAGGIAALFPLLAPLVPLAAPAVAETLNIEHR